MHGTCLPSLGLTTRVNRLTTNHIMLNILLPAFSEKPTVRFLFRFSLHHAATGFSTLCRGSTCIDLNLLEISHLTVNTQSPFSFCRLEIGQSCHENVPRLLNFMHQKES